MKQTQTLDTVERPKGVRARQRDRGRLRGWCGPREGTGTQPGVPRFGAEFHPDDRDVRADDDRRCEELVERGDLDPNEGNRWRAFLQRVVVFTSERAVDEGIEKRTVRAKKEAAT